MKKAAPKKKAVTKKVTTKKAAPKKKARSAKSSALRVELKKAGFTMPHGYEIAVRKKRK
jgi:hypothetical protein